MNFLFLQRLKYYIQITKPGISRAQILTVSIGFILAKQSSFFGIDYFSLILGTYLLSSSACAANSLIEKNSDRRMNRTSDRPLAKGVINNYEAIILIVTFFVLGIYFMRDFNAMTQTVAILTVVIYVALYTPLKKFSWINTPVGAIPGALPLLGGWFAAEAPLHIAVVALFFTLFCWQIPHFYALSIMYYDDYKSANFKMLPLESNGVSATKRQILFFTFLMIVSSLYPFFIGFLGIVYLVGILLLSVVFLLHVIRSINDLNRHAKKLFFLSIIYLPVWFGLILLDVFIG